MFAAAGQVDFCVCLTCKKGIVGEEVSHNHSRWLTMHSRSTGCRTAHRDALVAFRQVNGAQEPAPTQAPMLGIDAIWDDCKSDTRLQPVMTEVESFCREIDDVFEVKEGFKQLARSVVGYKKELTMTKATMEQLIREHERELTEHRAKITHMHFEMEGLRSCVRQMKYEQAEARAEVVELKRRIQQLENDASDSNHITNS
jgi:hypothetical protein